MGEQRGGRGEREPALEGAAAFGKEGTDAVKAFEQRGGQLE